MHLKKQIIGLFLLFVLIVPAVATYSWLQHHKRIVKREVKWKMIAGVDKKELVFFKFSNQDLTTKLRWEHSKEFEYKTQMYDVVEKKATNDSIYLWCWWDHEETKLNKQLQGLLVTAFQNDSQTKDKQNSVFKFYNLFFFQPEFSWEPFISTFYPQIIVSNNIEYQSVSILPSHLPPKTDCF